MKLATDFELPLFNKTTKKSFPAHIYIKGTKEQPLKTKNGYLQWDNAMLECATPVYDNKKDFVDGVRSVLTDSKQFIPPEIVPVFTDIMKYEMTTIMCPELQLFGCDPDMNAWTELVNMIPEHFSGVPYRTAGFHVHLDTKHKENMIKVLDFTVALPLLRHEKDSDFNRRIMYGGAGAWRDKKYGVEWRVLSPVVVKSKKVLGELWDLVERTQDEKIFNHYLQYINSSQGLREIIQTTINNKDFKTANALCKEYDLYV